MILALLSDIHGNLEALNACLKHARQAGAERLVFLGDLVGYGADPAAVVDLVRREAAGAVVLRGNHDDAVANPASYMNDSAKDAMDWAQQRHERLGQFLAFIPTQPPRAIRVGTNAWATPQAADLGIPFQQVSGRRAAEDTFSRPPRSAPGLSPIG